MKKYIALTISMFIILVVSITGFLVYNNVSAKPTEQDLHEKVNQEIGYLDTTIVSLINSFHNISYENYTTKQTEVSSKDQNSTGGSSESGSNGGNSDSSESNNKGGQQSENNIIKNTNIVSSSILTNTENKVDWESIMQQIELIYARWPSILIDLTSLNVGRENLLSFTSLLDEIVIELENKNSKRSLLKLSDLYRLLGLYIKDYSKDNMMINTFSIKAHIVHAYALAEDNKWDDMKQSISTAKSDYENILNTVTNNSNQNSINKGYILLNELEKNLNQENKNIFYINYKNLMRELNTFI